MKFGGRKKNNGHAMRRRRRRWRQTRRRWSRLPTLTCLWTYVIAGRTNIRRIRSSVVGGQARKFVGHWFFFSREFFNFSIFFVALKLAKLYRKTSLENKTMDATRWRRTNSSVTDFLFLNSADTLLKRFEFRIGRIYWIQKQKNTNYESRMFFSQSFHHLFYSR